jgi:DNA-binding NarL/FixJ family response regulator
MTRIGIIEDNIFLLKSFRDYLNSTEGMMVVFSCASMEEARDHFEKREIQSPDIILLDIFLPGESGMDGLPYLKEKFPDSKIIMLTAYNEDALLMKCFKLGAVGFALKNAQLSNMVEVVNQIQRTGAYIDENAQEKVIHHLQSKKEVGFLDKLTFREKEIVALVEKGYSYKQMAEHLFVTTFTINYHLKNIYKKLSIHSKSELLSRLVEESK